jgi:hypothetical protein
LEEIQKMKSLKVVSISLVFCAALVGCVSDAFTVAEDAGNDGDPTESSVEAAVEAGQDGAKVGDPDSGGSEAGRQETGSPETGGQDVVAADAVAPDAGEDVDSGIADTGSPDANDAGHDAGTDANDGGTDAAVCGCPDNGTVLCADCEMIHGCSNLCGCVACVTSICGCYVVDGGINCNGTACY